MEDRLNEEDREALAAITNAPPHRKAHSLSTQLRHGSAGSSAGATTVSGTGHKRISQHRNHSLDEDQIPNVTAHHLHHQDPYYDSSDDDFLPYSSNTTAAGISISSSSSNSSNNHRYDHSFSLPAVAVAGGPDEGSMPEFTASGGGSGIFRAPTRAAVHPSRPPALDLRPHPLRETQMGRFLRTIG